MRDEKLTLQKFSRKDVAIFLLFLAIFFVVGGTITMYKSGLTIKDIVETFFSVNVLSILIYALFLAAVIAFIMYVIAKTEEKRFLTQGTAYDGRIIGIEKKLNFMGANRSYVYCLKVRYVGGEFLSMPYLGKPAQCLESRNCVVYELNGKYYVHDFCYVGKPTEAEKKREAKFAVNAMQHSGNNCSYIIGGRTEVQLEGSYNYLFVGPYSIKFKDGQVMELMIDINILSKKRIKVFSTFDDELKSYVQEVAETFSSSEKERLYNYVDEKIKELMHNYYYFVEYRGNDILLCEKIHCAH